MVWAMFGDLFGDSRWFLLVVLAGVGGCVAWLMGLFHNYEREMRGYFSKSRDYVSFGCVDMAIVMARRALDVHKKRLPASDVYRVLICDALANNYFALGAHKEAEGYFKEVVMLDKYALKDHPNIVLNAFYRLGLLSCYAGKYRRAIACFERGYAVGRDCFDGQYDFPRTVPLLYEMGVCYRRLGEREEAVSAWQKGLEESKRQFHPNKEDLFCIYYDLMNVLNDLGCYDRVLLLSREALELLEDAEQEDMDYFGVIIHECIGDAYRGQKDYKGALSMYNKSIDINVNLPDGRCYNGLKLQQRKGDILFLLGDYKHALVCYEAVLTVVEEGGYEDDLLLEELVDVYAHAASIEAMNGDYEAACKHYRAASALADDEQQVLLYKQKCLENERKIEGV